jgi:hypothetical protein
MINAKVSKGAPKDDAQERLFKLLESMDWKLWEMYNMMKDLHQSETGGYLPGTPTVVAKDTKKKSADDSK